MWLCKCLVIPNRAQTQWYRIFSDFFIEQGNRIIPSTNGRIVCNLVKSYNIDYVIVQGSCEDIIDDYAICSTGIGKINLSSFRYLACWDLMSYAVAFSYIASGY